MPRVRSRLYVNLDPEKWPHRGLSPVNRVVLAAVMASILAAILESEAQIREISPFGFVALNFIFALLFTIEYLVRLWAMGESPQYAGFVGRFRYACTWASLLDLIATLALWAALLFGVQGFYGVLLRLFRVLRVLGLARNSEWAIAMRFLGRAIAERDRELILSFGFAGIILLVSATVLFIAEGRSQPEAFGSIPRAMWWAMVTLTTIGYGDVYPVTAIGKLCASVVAITSIAIIAMPTGIMAAAFSDAFQKLREDRTDSASETG